MSEQIIVHTIQQLMPYADCNGLIEIALRDKKKKFVAFEKVLLNEVSQGQEKQLVEKAINQLNSNASITEKGIATINTISKLQALNVVLGGATLCAIAAGFAVIKKELESISTQIDGAINEIINTEKQLHDMQTNFELKKVVLAHENMLDCRKKGIPYEEEDLRELVADEYSVLNRLINAFEKNLVPCNESAIVSIYSLAPMLAASLRYFDELYYFKYNKEIGDGDVWHTSHDTWMSVFDKMQSESFIKKLQDYAALEVKMNTIETDIFYLSLIEQGKAFAEDVSDNQLLIKALDDESAINKIKKAVNTEVRESIQETFEQVEGVLDNTSVNEAYNKAMKQVALAS